MDPRNVGVGAIQRSASGAHSRSRRTWAVMNAGAYSWCPDLDYLGDGVTSSVYRCRETNSGTFYAIKVFKDRPPLRELELLRKLQHDNIVRLISKEQFLDQLGNSKTGLVLEYCPGGSLHDYLKKPENWLGLGETDFLRLLYNMSDGLAYLREQQKVLHRDIKPGNILISWDSKHQPVFKLADFGSSRELEDDGEFQSLVGTYEFLHPNIYMEVYNRLNSGRPHPRQQSPVGHRPECDLWSLGVTLYQAATGRLPFSPYEGVRQNHRLMIEMMVQKPEDCISASQDSPNGTIEYSKTLPPQCQLSASVRDLLEKLLRGILACEFDKQWTFTKFFEAVSTHRRQLATHYFVPGLMFKPDLLYSHKATYDSLVQSLVDSTGYSKKEIIVFYRSQAVTAFPTGTTATCPIIVLSKDKYTCSIDPAQLNFDYVRRRPRDPDTNQIKEVKEYVENSYKLALACRDLSKAAHLNHSLVLEGKEATMFQFKQRWMEAHQRASSKIAMVSSSQQKVGRLLEVARLVRGQIQDSTFYDRVTEWCRKLDSVSSGLQSIQHELQDSNSSSTQTLDRLSESFNELFAKFGQPNLSAECLSPIFHRVELVYERYDQIVGMFKRGHNPTELVRSEFPSDRNQLRECLAACQRIVQTCCVEMLMNVDAQYNKWLACVYEEVQRLSQLEQQLQQDIEAELDMLHDKICRGTHEVLRCYFGSRKTSKENEFMALSNAIKDLLGSTVLVQEELAKNGELLQELDELGLRNCGQASLESQ